MEKYLELLKRLMDCKAVSSDVNAVDAAERTMGGFLEDEGLHVRYEELCGRRVAYASTVDGGTPGILFNAHLDVVPPLAEGQFTLSEKDGILKGRGVEDCQGNAICVAKILCDLKGKANVAAFFSADEELGGETTLAMVRKGYAAGRIAIVMDGDPYGIVTAQKGIIVLKFAARGTSGHSSTPWLFDNPICRLMEGYDRFRRAWPFKADAEDQWHPTFAPCMVNGGFAENQIPDYAEMTVNIRYTRQEDYQFIMDLARNSSGLDVTLERECRPYSCDEGSDAILGLKEALGKAFPDKGVAFRRMNGATDARHMGDMGVPVAILGIPGGGAHSADEWADIRGIAQYAECLENYALSLL